MLRFIAICLLLISIGCGGNSGPPTVSETSAARPKLADRIKFVETYVKFRRTYKELEYDISFMNGGSFPPSPSEWDVRLVAIVPPDEINNWSVAGKLDGTKEVPKWVADTAQSIDINSITEWYTDGNRTVGIDRKHNVVAYRSFAH